MAIDSKAYIILIWISEAFTILFYFFSNQYGIEHCTLTDNNVEKDRKRSGVRVKNNVKQKYKTTNHDKRLRNIFNKL